MAISKQVFTKNGQNDAQIDAAHDWATAFRVRLSDIERARYGACNSLRIVNTSGEDITVSLTWDLDRTDSYTVRTGGIFSITPEDGKKFYGFDVYNADGANNIPAEEIKYAMAVVLQVPEV